MRKEGVFPEPQVDATTGRLFYSDDQFQVCSDLRRRNVGMNGKVVLFYSPRPMTNATRPSKKKHAISKPSSEHSFIIESLKVLGLVRVDEVQVQRTIKATFPQGIHGLDQGEVVRAIFLAIKRQDTDDNVAR